MYLEAEIYISEYKDSEKVIFDFIKNSNPSGLGGYAPHLITFEVGYWRKANAIHRWFVKNVQDGKDDCERYRVSKENLEELKKICETVLKDINTGVDLLPTASGFFFGSNVYDEFYKQDLEQTIHIIDKIFNNPSHDYWDLYYCASW